MCPTELLGTTIVNGVKHFLYYGPVCGMGMMTVHDSLEELDPIGGSCPEGDCANPIVIGRFYDELDPDDAFELSQFARGRGRAFANASSMPMIPPHKLRDCGIPEYGDPNAPFLDADGAVVDRERFVVRYDQLDGSCTTAVLMRVQPSSESGGGKAVLMGHELAPGTPADETARLKMRFGFCDVIECRGEHYTVVRRGFVPRANRLIANMRFENFWHEFNRLRLHAPPMELYLAVARGYSSQGLTYDSLVDELRKSFADPGHPAPFAARIRASADGPRGLLDMARYLMSIADRHLSSPLDLRQAFEVFGQGVLYDCRTPCSAGQRVHMAEGTPQTWKSYHRWYAFFRAVSLLGDTSRDWLHVARCIGLAWAIQSEARPAPDNPANPGLPNSRLAALRQLWCTLSFDQLDAAFAKFKCAAPQADEIPPPATTGRYAAIQEMFSAAVGTALQGSAAHGRFWEVPWIDFMHLAEVKGKPWLAPPGPNRGARSVLVQALRGTIVEIGRMPKGMVPLSDDQIQFVEQWIDDGCPEY